jgi:hypothetical protein
MFQRFFVFYGVQIGLCVDRRALLEMLVPEHLPFGWCPVEHHQTQARASVQCDVLTGESGEPGYRVIA